MTNDMTKDKRPQGQPHLPRPARALTPLHPFPRLQTGCCCCWTAFVAALSAGTRLMTHLRYAFGVVIAVPCRCKDAGQGSWQVPVDSLLAHTRSRYQVSLFGWDRHNFLIIAINEALLNRMRGTLKAPPPLGSGMPRPQGGGSHMMCSQAGRTSHGGARPCRGTPRSREGSSCDQTPTGLPCVPCRVPCHRDSRGMPQNAAQSGKSLRRPGQQPRRSHFTWQRRAVQRLPCCQPFCAGG